MVTTPILGNLRDSRHSERGPQARGEASPREAQRRGQRCTGSDVVLRAVTAHGHKDRIFGSLRWQSPCSELEQEAAHGNAEGSHEEPLGGIGEGSAIRHPMYCDYGSYIVIGSGTFIDFGVMLIDVAPITIGNDCQIGPNVQFLTPMHPIDPKPRREKWEAARPISLRDNVWIGGGVIILPGVTIVENTVVGAGSLVTKDLLANVIAVGNPARVVREI